MKYNSNEAIAILEKTPLVLKSLLNGLDNEWVMCNEGPETFSPYDVLGHLIHAEKTDWVVRAKHVLALGVTQPFDPFDRFAHYEASKGKSLQQLFDEFEKLRRENIEWLQSLNLSETDLEKKGMHPALGEVTLRNLLATWVVHDLSHIAQVNRVMAKQYKTEVGPWAEYLRILKS